MKENLKGYQNGCNSLRNKINPIVIAYNRDILFPTLADRLKNIKGVIKYTNFWYLQWKCKGFL